MSSSPFDSLDVSDDVLSDVFSTSSPTSSPHTPLSTPASALLPQLSLDALLFGGANPVLAAHTGVEQEPVVVFDVAPPPPLDVATGAPLAAPKRKSPHVDATLTATKIHHDSPLRTPPIADETSSPTTTSDEILATTAVVRTAAAAAVSSSSSPGVKNNNSVAAPLQGALDASGYRPKPSKRARLQAQVAANGDEFMLLDEEPSTEEILSAAIAARDDETATLEAIALFPEVTADTSAALPRDALLQATSNALDEWQNRITAVRALTPADKRELQRQRRLVKNRESAQLSRLRKKGYIGELEAQLTKMAAENDNLKAQNVALREEVERLKRAAATTTGAPNIAVPPPPVAQAVYVDVDETPQAAQPRGSSRRQHGDAAVSLLLMLISFGALWNAGSRSRAPALNSASTALVPVGGRALMSVKDEEAKIIADGGVVPVAADVADAVDPIVVHDDTIAAAGDGAQQPFAWLSREAWRINASREADNTNVAAAAAAAAVKKAQPQQAENGFGTLLDIVDKSDRVMHEQVQQQIKLAKMKKQQQQQGVPQPAKPYSAAAAGMPVQKAPPKQQQQQQQQQSQQSQQQRKVSIEAVNAVAPWGEASGPVANATYWFVPQIRSLKRGDDATLLGIMLPLSALDPDAVPDSEDSPVVEVMCKVQSVQRTPFTQRSFEGDVHIE